MSGRALLEPLWTVKHMVHFPISSIILQSLFSLSFVFFICLGVLLDFNSVKCMPVPLDNQPPKGSDQSLQLWEATNTRDRSVSLFFYIYIYNPLL